VGIIRYKMIITSISAFMTAIERLYAQYITYRNPIPLGGPSVA
jgi:hypothetical protein